jgi:hypothetical protein
MATYGYQEPAIFESEYQTSPIVQAYFATSGHSGTGVINRADLVTLSSGQLNRALTTAGGGFSGTIAGLAVHGETAVFSSSTTGASAPPGGGGINNLFGATQITTASAANLLPGEPGQVHVNKLTGGQLVEFSLDKSVAWATNLIGSAVYLYLDSSSNLFYVSTTSSGTSIGNIVNVVLHATQGQIGDYGVRVLVSFAASIVN